TNSDRTLRDGSFFNPIPVAVNCQATIIPSLRDNKLSIACSQNRLSTTQVGLASEARSTTKTLAKSEGR
ncbi:MAG TPA: hypothetical protein VK673_07035, partial [Chthoniobacterales bacterium]|nr:hypothetical protein [Chthoniobacterales bacterium]